MQITARNKVASQFTDPLFSPSNARDKNKKPRGIYRPPVQGSRGGEEENFEQNEKKNTTSVYRLQVYSPSSFR